MSARFISDLEAEVMYYACMPMPMYACMYYRIKCGSQNAANTGSVLEVELCELRTFRRLKELLMLSLPGGSN